jgi:hypothetical protein
MIRQPLGAAMFDDIVLLLATNQCPGNKVMYEVDARVSPVFGAYEM